MALLTVLMPVFNAQSFLREAIDSILNQTLRDFELLIVNDASTDESLSIIQSYDDPRIRVVNNESNLGISATLNKGINLSTTELIARMDADDISAPTRLQKQYDFFLDHPDCALVSSWVNIVSEDGSHIHTEQFRSRYYYYNMTFDCWIYHPSVMYKKAVVLEVGAYNSFYSEDFDLFWHILRKYKIANIEEPLLDYRITSQSLHQVVKKAEYDAALYRQVIRNIKYYAGDNFHISYEEVQCLQFKFDSILKLNSIWAIVAAFKKLDIITLNILNHPNPNLEKRAVYEAWYYKRLYMRNRLFAMLGLKKKFLLRIALLTIPKTISASN